jgi:hypothetical protein
LLAYHEYSVLDYLPIQRSVMSGLTAFCSVQPPALHNESLGDAIRAIAGLLAAPALGWFLLICESTLAS